LYIIKTKTLPVNRGRILGPNPEKSLKSFPAYYSQSPLQFALKFIFLQIHATFNVFLQIHTKRISTVKLLYTVKEKGGKPDRNPCPLPYGLRIHTETSNLRTLKIMPQETSTKLYVHESGFSTKSIWIPVTGINIIFIAAVFSKKTLVSTNYYARTYSKCVSNATKLICWKYATTSLKYDAAIFILKCVHGLKCWT
jgi:hypothetical protein